MQEAPPSRSLPKNYGMSGRVWGRGRFSERSASPPDPLSRRVAGNRLVFFGSSRKVRETNREEPNEHKEETVISVAISKALGNFNLVIESLKFTC